MKYSIVIPHLSNSKYIDKCIEYIVNYNNIGKQEEGVRNIKRRIESIISKLNILYLTTNTTNTTSNV